MDATPYSIAQRYVGWLKEVPGSESDPFIQHCYRLCGLDPSTPDETPWCSAFLQHPFWELRLPRSKSARARSWLSVGVPVSLVSALPGFDVAILKRGEGPQPGPDVIDAPGHVGLLARVEGARIWLLAGNQGNEVSVSPFPVIDILGIRRCST